MAACAPWISTCSLRELDRTSTRQRVAGCLVFTAASKASTSSSSRFESMTRIPERNWARWFNVLSPSPKEATTAIQGQAASDVRSDCCMMPGRETTAVGMGWLFWRVVSIISMRALSDWLQHNSFHPPAQRKKIGLSESKTTPYKCRRSSRKTSSASRRATSTQLASSVTRTQSSEGSPHWSPKMPTVNALNVIPYSSWRSWATRAA